MREPRLVKRREPHSENFSMEFAGGVPSRVVKTDEPYSENFRMGFVNINFYHPRSAKRARESHSEMLRIGFAKVNPGFLSQAAYEL